MVAVTPKHVLSWNCNRVAALVCPPLRSALPSVLQQYGVQHVGCGNTHAERERVCERETDLAMTCNKSKSEDDEDHLNTLPAMALLPRQRSFGNLWMCRWMWPRWTRLIPLKSSESLNQKSTRKKSMHACIHPPCLSACILTVQWSAIMSTLLHHVHTVAAGFAVQHCHTHIQDKTTQQKNLIMNLLNTEVVSSTIHLNV